MDAFISLLFLLVFAALVIGGCVFLWQQTKTKGRWGFSRMFGVTCPKCGTKMPAVRKPASTEEFLWGGWTCPNCGAKIDKYGRERVS